MYSDPQKIWERGNCRDCPDPDIFFPERDAETYPTVAGEAKQYCRGNSGRPRCDVILDCLFYGLVTEDRFGVWGGMSTRERNALRRSGSLEKYSAVQDLDGSPIYQLIDNYLTQNKEQRGGEDH